MKEKLLIHSECLREDVSAGVVLPNGCCRRIMILLHGYSGSYEELEDKLPLQEYADKYKMIMLCPNLGNGYYIDREGKKYGSFLAQELPEYIRKHYHEEHVAEMILAGISMGGYGAMLTGCHYPKNFSHIISLGGAFIAHDVSIGNPEICGSSSNMAAVHYFLSVFGPDVSDLDTSIDRNPLAAIRCIKDTDNQPFFWLICGKRDLMYSRNLKAVSVLSAHGLKFKWHELAGGHTYACFDEGLHFTMDQIAGSNLPEE